MSVATMCHNVPLISSNLLFESCKFCFIMYFHQHSTLITVLCLTYLPSAGQNWEVALCCLLVVSYPKTWWPLFSMRMLFIHVICLRDFGVTAPCHVKRAARTIWQFQGYRLCFPWALAPLTCFEANERRVYSLLTQLSFVKDNDLSDT